MTGSAILCKNWSHLFCKAYRSIIGGCLRTKNQAKPDDDHHGHTDSGYGGKNAISCFFHFSDPLQISCIESLATFCGKHVIHLPNERSRQPIQAAAGTLVAFPPPAAGQTRLSTGEALAPATGPGRGCGKKDPRSGHNAIRTSIRDISCALKGCSRAGR